MGSEPDRGASELGVDVVHQEHEWHVEQRQEQRADRARLARLGVTGEHHAIVLSRLLVGDRHAAPDRHDGVEARVEHLAHVLDLVAGPSDEQHPRTRRRGGRVVLVVVTGEVRPTRSILRHLVHLVPPVPSSGDRLPMPGRVPVGPWPRAGARDPGWRGNLSAS